MTVTSLSTPSAPTISPHRIRPLIETCTPAACSSLLTSFDWPVKWAASVAADARAAVAASAVSVPSRAVLVLAETPCAR